MDITKVVVIGSGMMGSGIAYVVAKSGRDVIMVDREKEFLDSGMKRVRTAIKEGIERGKMSPAEGEKLSHKFKTNLDLKDACSGAQLVIEAAFENMDVKKEIFGNLSDFTDENTILATNTSTLSISKIQEGVINQERVIGLHFFNPPAAMKLVEVIHGTKTSETTINAMMEFVESIGKTAVKAKDAPGFIVNRLLIPMLNEAVKLLDEGTATIDDIDKAAVLGANFPAGPFVLADMVGLDVALASMNTLHKELGEGYKPSPTLIKLVEEGRLGMKTGHGFHKY